MKTYIAFIRGINVGGHKKIPMAELKALLTKIGLENVQTYIQSGNVVFQSSNNNTKNLENGIQKSILNQFGFDVPVLVKIQADLLAIFNACPFQDEKKKESYFILLDEIPEENLITENSEQIHSTEEFLITKECVYIYYVLGAGKGKLGVNWFEKKLKVNATARNYKTMVKLLSLSQTND